MSIRTHARQVYLGTAAERAGTTPDAEAVAVRFFETDTGDEYVWTGAAWVAAGGGGGGWPFTTVTVDLADADADYASLETAFATEGATTTYEIGPGIHTLTATPLPASSRLCSDPGQGLYQYAGVTGYTAAGVTYGLPTAGAGDVDRVRMNATGAGTDDAVGYEAQGGRLIHSMAIVGNGGTGDSFAVDVAAGVTQHIYGGEYTATRNSGSAYAIRVGAGATVYLYNLPTLNGQDAAISNAGTVVGWYYDSSTGNVVCASGDDIVLDTDGDTSIGAPTDDQIDFELAGADVIRFLDGSVGDANVWRLGDRVLNLDFTGTDYDTDAEMNAAGIRLSDADTPFPTALVWTISGTWGHSAGNGWLAAPSVDTQGPGMLIPLMRPDNWELSLTLTYSAAAASDQMICAFGYITNSNHYGAATLLADNDNVTSVFAQLITNDGDDTFTSRYSGAALAGTGDRVVKFRCQNGCVRVYDPQDTAWHDYEGRQVAGISYTAAYAFIQFYKYTAITFATTYIKDLQLTYLL